MGRAMAANVLFFVVVVMTLSFLPEISLGKSSGKTYKVGDADGWTILGNVNYTAWAASKTFRIGDKIVFEYNKQFHNVMEVTRSDYRNCGTTSPLTTYSTGNDSVVMRRGGHHFFLCGVPGHCAAGQRVDIRIPKLKRTSRARSTAPPTESPSPATPTPAKSPAQAPNKSRAAATNKVLATAMTVFAVAAAVYCTL